MTLQSDDATREQVKAGYAAAACCAPSSCSKFDRLTHHANSIGYESADLASVPDGANLALGCGNPTALAQLKPGDVVVDLGSGAGMDAFIAAPRVGPEGRVIGVDMTPQMLERARANAVRAGITNVEFREGIIEELPVASNSADVVISNCVINLSPDKAAAFKEAFRVLKPGGRLAVSDILLTEPLPRALASNAPAYLACIGGALVADDYLALLREAGFEDLRYESVSAADLFDMAIDDPVIASLVTEIGSDQLRAVANTVYSYRIEARKP